jgi:hypothetical protein
MDNNGYYIAHKYGTSDPPAATASNPIQTGSIYFKLI